jgi:hypothetical protein
LDRVVVYSEGIEIPAPEPDLICLACGREPVATGAESNRRLCSKCLKARRRKRKAEKPKDRVYRCVAGCNEPVKRRGWLCYWCLRRSKESAFGDRARHRSAEESNGDLWVQPRDRGQWRPKGMTAHKPGDWDQLSDDCRRWANHDEDALDSEGIAEAWGRAADPAIPRAQDPVIAMANARRRRRGKDPHHVDLHNPRAVHLVIDMGVGWPPAVGWSPAIEPNDHDAIVALTRNPTRCRVCRGAPMVSRTGAIAVCLGCLRSGVDHVLQAAEARHA